jgi:hypothetical protein
MGWLSGIIEISSVRPIAGGRREPQAMIEFASFGIGSARSVYVRPRSRNRVKVTISQESSAMYEDRHHDLRIAARITQATLWSVASF